MAKQDNKEKKLWRSEIETALSNLDSKVSNLLSHAAPQASGSTNLNFEQMESLEGVARTLKEISEERVFNEEHFAETITDLFKLLYQITREDEWIVPLVIKKSGTGKTEEESLEEPLRFMEGDSIWFKNDSDSEDNLHYGRVETIGKAVVQIETQGSKEWFELNNLEVIEVQSVPESERALSGSLLHTH